jgi:hypothetical protein
VWLLADPADLVRDACTLLAGLVPRLAELTPDPDAAEFAAAGVTARPSAAPLPGNVPAFYAKTGVEASALHLEGVLKYAAGNRRGGPLVVRGWSDANVLLALAAIPALFAAVEGDPDTERLVIAELEQRAEEARRCRAIDEAEQWRPLRSRPCPCCGCYFLRVLLDAAARPAGRVECFGHLPSGKPCRATWGRVADIVPDLARAESQDG